jgi:hypothetical protein
MSLIDVSRIDLEGKKTGAAQFLEIVERQAEIGPFPTMHSAKETTSAHYRLLIRGVSAYGGPPLY